MPDEHADPVETATPSRSSAISSDSASMPSKLMFVVFGHAAVWVAVDRRAGHARRECRARVDRAARPMRAARARASSRAMRAADAEPGDGGDVLRAGAPVALLPAAGHERRQAARRGESRARRRPSVRRTCAPTARADRRRARGPTTGILPTDCTASVWNSAPCACAIAASSAIGWIVPTSLLACITETSAVSSVIASFERARRSTTPSRLDGKQRDASSRAARAP